MEKNANLNTNIEQLLDRLSVAVLMGEGDALAEPETVELKKCLVLIAEGSQTMDESLYASTLKLVEQLSAPKISISRSKLEEYISKAQHHLRTGEPLATEFYLESDEKPAQSKSPSESTTAPGKEDISPDLDRELLAEFIEKHGSLMDEMEAVILEHRAVYESLAQEERNESDRELTDFVKRYLHNIKGDSGSIGLCGLERLFHVVEDLLIDNTASKLTEMLLELKTWSVEYMQSLAKGEVPTETGAAFCDRVVRIDTAQESPSGVSAEKEMPAEANLELLAELMADPSPTVKDNKPAASVPVAAQSTKAQSNSNHPALPAVDTEYSLSGEPDIFQEFCVEAEEHLSGVEAMILEAEGVYSKDAVDAIFRSIHSIKGSSAYFGLKEIGDTSHLTESVLDEVRAGKRQFDTKLTELLVRYLDLQRNLIGRSKKAVSEGASLRWGEAAVNYLRDLRSYAEGSEPENTKAEVQQRPQIDAAPSKSPKSGAEGTHDAEKLDVKSFVKVETRRLDQLIDAIGEMGIYCSMLIDRCRTLMGGDESVTKITHQVEKVTRDVQNIGMSMRLIPIRGLFQKMSRLVWDLSKKMGKDIKFSMEGEDTELDRSIIDRLADPLMHMIRNALDHGVEPPEDREKSGKARQGQVKLSAYHSGGCIHIRIEDDGRGMDPGKLVKKAIEKGILTEGTNLSAEDAFQLIFAAGFSTAAVVSDVSGRGVGMDVVKRNIEGMRGRVRIESRLGFGSTFTIELPLTLAIVDGIEVCVGREHFIVPMLSIVEFMRPDPSLITRTLERGETFFFRGRYLPVFRLSELFGVDAAVTDVGEATFIVVEAHGDRYTLMVDEIVGSLSVVIKSLGALFEQGRGLAGCSIMANGEVALILDVTSLLNIARIRYSHVVRRLGTECENSDSQTAVTIQ